MKYKSITYGYLRSLGNYENERISLEAEIEEGENYESVLEQLKKNVHNSLNDFDSYYKKEREMRELKNQIERLIGLREEAERQYEAIRLFLETQGIKTGMPLFPQHSNVLMPAEPIEAENLDNVIF